MQNIYQNKKGMTLIETIISLGILMIGVMASVTLMMASFNRVQESEQEIVVVNLAREGIEIVRAMRNNEHDSTEEDVDIFSGEYDNARMIVDRNTVNSNTTMRDNIQTNVDSIEDCDDCELYMNNGSFTHSSVGEPTIYKRVVSILPTASSAEKIVTSEIMWTIKGKIHTYTLETTLTDWQ